MQPRIKWDNVMTAFVSIIGTVILLKVLPATAGQIPLYSFATDSSSAHIIKFGMLLIVFVAVMKMLTRQR
ncbi:MAG: hypothetical protein COA73_12130 [Candidatus Hydrogenedentota bacterium]|nr:MAG: hypothetical protein COA73_12130 [Candidatus Hydrogenedentota bacterium]